MSYQYLLEIDAGYHIKRWGTTGTTGVYSHAFTDLDPANVYVDGTQLGERTTYGACTGTQTTWYVDRGTTLYVHTPGNADANTKTVKVESTLHFSREGAIVPKALGTGGTVFPLFFDGRMKTVPSVSYYATPNSMGGGVIPSIGNIMLLNNDAHFDDLLPKMIWKNQPARLYVGEEGGTIPAGYTLRQRFTLGAPAIDETTMSIPTAVALERLRNSVNDGSTISVVSEGLSVTKPSPFVFGPFVGLPAYYTGSSGTVGTYQLCAHPIGTVNRIWNSSGTAGTLLNSGSKFSAHPLSVLGNSQVFVNGTGLTSGGTALMKAGEIMQYLLASQARIPGTEIATTNFSNLDTNRPVKVRAWFGRDETVEEGMDAISRSAFAQWSVGRDGKFGVNPIQNVLGTSNTIQEYDFEGYRIGDPLESFSTTFPVRLSASKMLLYTSYIFKDSTAGNAVYRNGTLGTKTGGTAPSMQQGSVYCNMPLSGGDLRIYINYNGTIGAETAYEMVVGTGSPALITMNKISGGTRTLKGTVSATNADSYGSQIALVLWSSITSPNLYVIPRVGVTYASGSFTESTSVAIGSGYVAVSFEAATASISIGTTGLRIASVGQGSTVISEDYSAGIAHWQNNNGAYHEATAVASKAFSGTKCLWVSRGTNGGSAHIAYGTGVSVTSGSDYMLTMLAAKQSGDASAFRLGFLDGSGTQYLSATSWGLGTTEWARTSYIFEPPTTGTGTIQVYPSYGGTLAGTCWIDYVEMYQIKTVNSWQLKGFATQLINPMAHQVSVKYAGTGTVTKLPAEVMKTNITADDNYFTSVAGGTAPAYLYSGMERRTIPGLCYAYEDATTVANAALNYYSKPRIRWEADYEDFRQDTINLWDVLYIQDGRFPGIPEEQRLLMVTEIEDSAPSGVPRTHIGGEFVFDAANDLLKIIYE